MFKKCKEFYVHQLNLIENVDNKRHSKLDEGQGEVFFTRVNNVFLELF